MSRFSVTTVSNTYQQMIFSWSPNCVRSLQWSAPALTATTSGFYSYQQQQLNANNTVPLDIRPLRMSVRVRNTSQNLNIAGNVVSCLVPQSVVVSFAAANNITPASLASLWGLVHNNPRSKSQTGLELQKTHAYIMPPSSFVAYNSYQDFVPLTTASDNAPLAGADFISYFFPGATTMVYPATASGGALGNVPTNYVLLLNIPPNPLACTYEFEVYCQDAVRYPANTMAASVRQPAPNPNTTVPDAAVQASAAAAADNHVQPAQHIDAATLALDSAAIAAPFAAGHISPGSVLRGIGRGAAGIGRGVANLGEMAVPLLETVARVAPFV